MHTKSIKMKLSLQKYKLIIFDWDGTLVDSLGVYKSWDKLYVEKFYGVDLSIEYLNDLAKKMKVVTPAGVDNKYFRHLDVTYGSGATPMEVIWKNLYSLAPELQSEVKYREGAVKTLAYLREHTDAPIVLATNAEMRDIKYFSSHGSNTAKHLSPIDFFDMVVTSDEIRKPKPDPETFLRVISRYGVNPGDVLIFEDSIHGVRAAKAAGADVVAIHAESDAKEHADMQADSWGEVLRMLERDVS